MCAEVSKRSDKPVYHQTVHAQNSMLTKQIHDQGKNITQVSMDYEHHECYKSHLQIYFSWFRVLLGFQFVIDASPLSQYIFERIEKSMCEQSGPGKNQRSW